MLKHCFNNVLSGLIWFQTACKGHQQITQVGKEFRIVLLRRNLYSFSDNYRWLLHSHLCLPTDRPLFRTANRFLFPDEQHSRGYLYNVHEGLPPSKGKILTSISLLTQQLIDFYSLMSNIPEVIYIMYMRVYLPLKVRYLYI